MKFLKRLSSQVSELLQSDIGCVAQNFTTQILAIYRPQLIPIRANGVIIDWIDSRTGERPWFY